MADPVKEKGWKTSEFWTAFIAAQIPLLNSAFGWNLPTEAIIGFLTPVVAYIVSRGLAKKTTPPAA